MKLYLAVPQQLRQTNTETVTRPAQTREWIARLPLLNTRESLRQVHSALHGINRIELKVTQRLKLLDMYRSPLRVIRGQVQTQLAKGAVPLSDNDLLSAELFRDCCVEMAYGYKATILEIAQSRKRRQLDEMRLSMGRALFYLEQTVFACALYRQAPPEGIWQETHTIYCYARQLGIVEDPIKDPIAKARTTTSISLTYRRVLLFGLSDPFHQSIPLMTRVLEFLRRHAQNAQLRPYSRPPTERCQFVIDPQSDRPARAYLKQTEEKPPKDALLLDTVNLTRHAHDQLKRLASAEQVDVDLDDEFQDDLGRKLLEEVVYAWGLTPRRAEERTESADGGQPVEIMTGMAAANYCINGEKEFGLSSTDHADHSATAGTFQLHQLRRRQSSTEKLECLVLDRGESGLCLGASYDKTVVGSLRVGEVVAVREKNGPWAAGLIRWMRCVEDTIQFGVKLLNYKLRPVAVKPVSTEREEPFKEALAFYPEDDPHLQLISPPGLYRYQRNLFVDDGETLLMTRSHRLIERSQLAEWFECETLNL